MTSQTQGIQQLLTAEKRAAEKVAEARKSKFYFFFKIFSPNSFVFIFKHKFQTSVLSSVAGRSKNKFVMNSKQSQLLNVLFTIFFFNFPKEKLRG